MTRSPAVPAHPSRRDRTHPQERDHHSDSTHDETSWTIDVSIAERPSHTRAKAKLPWCGGVLTGIGIAWLNPADRNIAEIGDELGAARALSNLADSVGSPRPRPTSMTPPTSRR